MLGKTFKGMTDEILAWQTERFLALETGREGHVVHVRPEQVVEIAFDGCSGRRDTRVAWHCVSPACCAIATTNPRPRPTPWPRFVHCCRRDDTSVAIRPFPHPTSD